MAFEDPDQIVQDLMMSPTLERIAEIAAQSAHRLDMADPNDRKIALATSSVGIIRALDAERIRIDTPQDLELLHTLLVAAMEVIHDGSFGSEAVQVSTLQ